MSFKDAVDSAADGMKKTGANVKDALNEAGHRANAEGEKAKRDLAGDQMTSGEKVGSMFRQATKRDVRNNT